MRCGCVFHRPLCAPRDGACVSAVLFWYACRRAEPSRQARPAPFFFVTRPHSLADSHEASPRATSSELDEYEQAHKGEAEPEGRPVKSFEKTSLLPVIGLFDKFLTGLSSEIRVAQREARMDAEEGAAATGDW